MPVNTATHDTLGSSSEPASEALGSGSVSLSSAGSTASVSSTVDCPAAPRTELQLIGESAAQAAPFLSTEPAAPAVPAVPELLVRHACSSSSSSADGPGTLGQLFAIGSRAELPPLTFPGIRGRHSRGGIVDILDYDARTALYTVTPVIGLARPRGGIAEERLAN